MTKAKELREMSDEQLDLTLKEAADKLFHARLQAQTERLDAPSELKRHRRLIARVKTIQTERPQEEPPRTSVRARKYVCPRNK